MAVNAANAGSAGTSFRGPRIRNKNGPISARNQRRLDKKKKKIKRPGWEGDVFVYLTPEGIKTHEK